MRVPFLDLQELHMPIEAELREAASRVVSSGSFILGEEVERFEEEFAAYCGSRFCIGVSNGLDSLRMALIAAGVGEGDEVLVPAQTFIATWLAVSGIGAIPVGVDVQEDSFGIDPNMINTAISSKTKALIAVHLFGHVAEMDALKEICESHGLILIEDAAQAHGAELKGKRVGGLGNTACWSFYPGKNLGCLGDGGAITTDDPKVYEAVKKLRNYGSSKKYIHEVKGENSRLDEIQAAMLRVKLRYLDAWNDRRALLAERYSAGLTGLPLKQPIQRSGTKHAWHLYVIQTSDRDALGSYLADRGIGTLVHYPHLPCEQGAYREYADQEYKTSRTIAARGLSIPMSPSISDDQVSYVIESIKDYFS